MRHSLRLLLPSVLCLFFASTFLTPVQAGVQTGWKLYKGHYFQITIPPGFVAQPQESSSNDGVADEVWMWNAKTQVQFCVYSPLWNGHALFKKIRDASEVLTSREKKRVGDVEEEQLTITARDKSYVRYVVSHYNRVTNNNTTFGIRVPNMQVYTEVQPVYVAWKKTLVQWAD